MRGDLVREARALELAFFTAKGVWKQVAKSRSFQDTGRPPISVRWVDVNKGDEIDPNYRSRLLARQMRHMSSSGQNFFAPAPPLEALKTIISLAATRIGSHVPNWSKDAVDRTQISLIDVKRAYFNAEIDDSEGTTYVELPVEDPDHLSKCAQFLRHMYGTRAMVSGRGPHVPISFIIQPRAYSRPCMGTISPRRVQNRHSTG